MFALKLVEDGSLMRLLAMLTLLVLLGSWAGAQSDVKIVPEPVLTNLDFPIALAFVPDDRANISR